MNEMNIENILIDEIVVDGDWAAPPKLLASIREVGLLVPIIALFDGEKYYLHDGRSRLACMKKLGRSLVAARVIEASPLLSGDALTLSANIRGSNPLAEARAIARLKKSGMDDGALSVVSGKSKAQRRKLEKLLRLAPQFQDMLEGRELAKSTASHLSKLKDHAAQLHAYKLAQGESGKDKPPAAIVDYYVRDALAKERTMLPIPLPSEPANSDGDPIAVASYLRRRAALMPKHKAEKLIGAAKVLEEG